MPLRGYPVSYLAHGASTVYKPTIPNTPLYVGKNPQRASTVEELCAWMNEMSHNLLTGVIHWTTEGEIHFARLGDNGAILEMGVL